MYIQVARGQTANKKIVFKKKSAENLLYFQKSTG